MKNIIKVGSHMDNMSCESNHKLCKAIVKRLFKNKTEANISSWTAAERNQFEFEGNWDFFF